ncbi:MAG: DUF3108 domain-containing protein [Thiobacillaceae bacterium]|nr:DUF3108 domain-containing protein [Thiobacillaceae bacterium]
MRGRRKLVPIAAAVSLSLLLHVLLLTGFDIELAKLQALSDPPPIEARLVRVEPAPSPPPPRAVRRIPPQPAPAVPPPPQVEAEPEPVEAAAPELPVEAPVDQQAPAVAEQPPAEAVTAVPLNRLPDRIEMIYDIRYGPASGQQTLNWIVADGRYTISSVAGATGLTRMLYSGQLIQTSQGRVTASGLQPEAFWDQRGKKRSSGRFDFGNRSLSVSRGSSVKTLPLPDDAQDSQSLLFHFALHAPNLDAEGYHVFDGRKLRPYYFVLRGEETLDTPLGPLKTLHLERANAPEDRRFEVWLAVDLHYLPVRVLRPEEGGMDGEVVIRSITYPR